MPRWTIVVMMVAAVATVVHLLRRQSDGIMAELDRAAREDHVTRLLNRRGFDEQLGLEVQRATRSRSQFALLAPGATANEGLLLAERLRDAVSGVRDPAAAPLSLSLGVAEFPRDATTAAELFAKADVSLSNGIPRTP